MTSPGPLRLILADPRTDVRDSLRAALATEPDLEVVDEAEDAPGLLASAALALPDVVLVDLALLAGYGGGLVPAVLVRSPASRVIVLSALEGEGSIAAALEEGAHGHLRKDAFREELIAIVREAAGGDREGGPVGPGGAGRRGPAARAADVASSADLTPREVEILRLIARGRSNREIGAALAIAEGTVKGHLQRIFHKMGVEDRTQAAIAALKRGAIRL